MRCIDHPTMVKDGATWGGFTGVSAALLAQMGHTGAPAVTVESQAAAPHWADLGTEWEIANQYVKPYPVCRWAQPAIAAALSLAGQFDVADITSIEIQTFHEARRLPLAEPNNTEEAQYSIRFPVAAALVRGRIGVDEVSGTALHDSAILRIANIIEVTECNEANAAFPLDRLARLRIVLTDGRMLKTDLMKAIGDPDSPLNDQQMFEKFSALGEPVLGSRRANAVLQACLGLWDADNIEHLIALVMPAGKVQTISSAALRPS
jgi:2-methylcitrate dehydratase PrpD